MPHTAAAVVDDDKVQLPQEDVQAEPMDTVEVCASVAPESVVDSKELMVADVKEETDGDIVVEHDVRTVQSQHGDFRTVDEENIVVLTRCWTPDITAELLATESVWVQTDPLGRDADEVSVACFFFWFVNTP